MKRKMMDLVSAVHLSVIVVLLVLMMEMIGIVMNVHLTLC